MGLIVDIVPNHMAADAANSWWFDVLRNGRGSRYAAYFDIDWDAEDETLRGKVLLPVLGKPLHDALRDDEISLAHEGGEDVVRYFQHRFPLSGAVHRNESPEKGRSGAPTLPPCLVADRKRRGQLASLLRRQRTRRSAHGASDAFEAVHALIFRLYAAGVIDGVRVDHIDGLADPAGYCRTLRRRLDALTAQRPSSAPRGRPYIIVEKILLRREQLPAAWQCDGTSGYDFMNEVSAVQHDARGEPILSKLWDSLSGRSADFATEEQAARREIIARSFSAQLEACAASFQRLARVEGHDIAARRCDVRWSNCSPIFRSIVPT